MRACEGVNARGVNAFPRRRGKGHARERRSQRVRSERLPPQAGEGAMRASEGINACRMNFFRACGGRGMRASEGVMRVVKGVTHAGKEPGGQS